MTIYFYNIGYGTYEESEYAQLYHTTNFSEKGLKQVIYETVVRVLENIAKDDLEKPYWQGRIREGGIRYTEIHEDVIKELIEHEGFRPVEFTAKFSTFGWVDILDKKDWEGQRSPENDEMYSVVTSFKPLIENINKIIAVRKKQHRQQMNELDRKRKVSNSLDDKTKENITKTSGRGK